MLDQSLTLLSFRRMIRLGASHRTSSATSRSRGPGAGDLCPGNSHLSWFSVHVRNLKKHVIQDWHALRRAHAF